jgi:hypothetical protein
MSAGEDIEFDEYDQSVDSGHQRRFGTPTILAGDFLVKMVVSR